MGQTSHEFTSVALSANYVAYYREFQILNWCPVDIVITEPSGEQQRLPACKPMRDNEAGVEIQYRKFAGMRIEYTTFGNNPIPLKGTRTAISYDTIRNHPYRLLDHNLIISTVDQSCVARDMLTEFNCSPVLYETRVDDTIADPRFVFQVIDPDNRWDEIYVHVFGQTVKLRAGYWSNILPIDTSSEKTDPRMGARLICYLRYPNEYCNTERSISTVFEISLDTIENEEPMVLPDGQTICVAATEDSIKRVIAKRMNGIHGTQIANLANSKMVPKELYDSAIKDFENQLARQKAEAKAQLDTMVTRKNNEIAKVQAERDAEKAKVTSLQTQLERWESLNRANTAFHEDRAKAELADSKVRDAAVEAARKDVEHAWLIIKLGGGLMATILTFALTVFLKKK